MNGQEEKYRDLSERVSKDEEEFGKLSERVTKAEDEIKSIVPQITNLRTEYHSDKKMVKWGVGMFGIFLLAFFGFTFLQIPGQVKKQLDLQMGKEIEEQLQQKVGPEILKKVQEMTIQISQFAIDTEDAAKRVEDFKSVTEKNADQIESIAIAAKENFKKISELVGSYLSFVKCNGDYNCTPRDCLTKCMERDANGHRH